MNPRQLLALKDAADEVKAKWNALDAQLRVICNHPAPWVDKKGEYYTDTIGANGRTEYHFTCSICGKYFDAKDYKETGKENEG